MDFEGAKERVDELLKEFQDHESKALEQVGVIDRLFFTYVSCVSCFSCISVNYVY